MRKNLFPVKVSIKAFLIFVQISKQRKALETVSWFIMLVMILGLMLLVDIYIKLYKLLVFNKELEVIHLKTTYMRNNILGAVVYLSTTIVFGGSTALLMLFIKENSDRCHYYNGNWSKADLAIGISSIVLGSIAKYFVTLI